MIKYKENGYKDNKIKSNEYKKFIDTKELISKQIKNREEFKKKAYNDFVDNFNYDWECSLGCRAYYKGEVIHRHYGNSWTQIDHYAVSQMLPQLFDKYVKPDEYLDGLNSRKFGNKQVIDNFSDHFPYNKKYEVNLKDKYKQEDIEKCKNIYKIDLDNININNAKTILQ